MNAAKTKTKLERLCDTFRVRANFIILSSIDEF